MLKSDWSEEAGKSPVCNFNSLTLNVGGNFKNG